jgi:serine/threonine-protein kinase RsbW
VVSESKEFMSVEWKYEQRISSDPNLCAPIVEQLISKLDEFGWADKDAFAIHMAVEEAIINAIKHGNECRPNTTVHIKMKLTGEQFQATVTDEGPGFDLDNIPDPTNQENVEKCSGRGVMLIRHFVDEVQYNSRGNSVSMTKHKSN